MPWQVQNSKSRTLQNQSSHQIPKKRTMSLITAATIRKLSVQQPSPHSRGSEATRFNHMTSLMRLDSLLAAATLRKLRIKIHSLGASHPAQRKLPRIYQRNYRNPRRNKRTIASSSLVRGWWAQAHLRNFNESLNSSGCMTSTQKRLRSASAPFLTPSRQGSDRRKTAGRTNMLNNSQRCWQLKQNSVAYFSRMIRVPTYKKRILLLGGQCSTKQSPERISFQS